MAGITSKRKDPVPARISAYDPENMHLSKAEFVEKQRKMKEQESKIKEYKAGLDKEESEKKLTGKKPKEIK